MNRVIKFLTVLVFLAIIITPAYPVYAQSGQPGQIIFGNNYTLKSGDELDGDLVVIGGNVTVEKDAVLNGNLIVVGGTVSSDGNLKGDVVVFGGQIALDKNAVVAGDVVTVGGQLTRAEGAEIKGDVVKNVSPNVELPNGNFSPKINPANVNVNFNPFWTAAGVFYRALIIAALAMLIVIFLKPQMEQVGQAIVRQPLMSGGMGLLAVVGGPLVVLIASVIMIVTLILIPVAALVLIAGALLLALAWLFGVIAIGYEVGERFTQSINQTWAPVFTTGFGTFLVVLIGGALGQVPCVGWVVPTVIGLVAIGAVVMTRFGVRPVQSAAVAVYMPPVNTEPPASQA